MVLVWVTTAQTFWQQSHHQHCRRCIQNGSAPGPSEDGEMDEAQRLVNVEVGAAHATGFPNVNWEQESLRRTTRES